MTDTNRTLRDVFLSRFDIRMRTRLCEYGKELTAIDADYVFTMARKATCLIDCLARLNLAHVRGVITSERVLDMPTGWLEGKRVALVDDALISGTTLARARQAILDAKADVVATKVVCVNSKWWEPALIEPDGPFEVLSDSATGAFCANLTRALSLFPRPYGVDYPIFGGMRVPTSQLDNIFRLPGWRTYDFTDAIQRVNDVMCLVAEPCADVRHELDKSLGWPLSRHASLLKLRIYGRVISPKGTRAVGAFRVMPILAFDPLDVKSVDAMWEALIAGDLLTTGQLKASFGDATLPKLRLLQYVLASRLARVWFSHVTTGVDRTITLKHELGGVLAVFSPPVAEKVLRICESEKPLLLRTPLDGIVASPVRDEIPASVSNIADPWHAQARLLEPFLWMYKHRELPARKAVKATQGNALNDPDYAPVLDRLRMGVCLPDLRKRSGDSGDGRTASQAVSEFLDTAIDRGFVVPVTMEQNGVVFRAYRHGEDVKDSEQLRRLARMTVAAFAENAGIECVPKTWTEKLLVLLIKLLVDKRLVDPSDSMLGAYGTVGVRYDMHGPVLKKEVHKLYSVHDQQAYTELLCECGYLREVPRGYTIGDEPEDVPQLPEGEILAEKLGACLGMLYHPRPPKGETVTRLELFDVVLLASCSSARDTAGALGAELELYQYHWSSLERQVRLNIRNADMASRVLRDIRSSVLYTAINSGMAKFRGYQDDASTETISRISDELRTDTARRLLWRDLWASAGPEDRENVGPSLIELVMGEGRILLAINCLMRILELLCLSIVERELGDSPVDDSNARNAEMVRAELRRIMNELNSLNVHADQRLEATSELADRAIEEVPSSSGELRRLQLATADLLAWCCYAARGLLSEVDGVAARYGQPPAVDHFQSALVVEIAGVNEDETRELVRTADGIIASARLAARKARGGRRLEPVEYGYDTRGDRVRRWIFARGVGSRRSLIALAAALQSKVIGPSGGRSALFFDFERFEQPVIVGCANIVRNSNFWARTDSILKAIHWQTGTIEVFAPIRSVNIKQLKKEIVAGSQGHLAVADKLVEMAVDEPVPETFLRVRVGLAETSEVTEMFAKADIGVVTVIPSEGGAVVKRLQRFPTYRRSLEGRYYHGAKIPGERTTHRLVMTASVDQGQSQVMPACFHLMQRFDPCVLIVVGVGGSIHKDASLFDVCIADQMISYTKVKEKADSTVARRGTAYRLEPWLKALINEFFIKNGQQPATIRIGKRRFKVHYGPVGTGNAVVGYRESDTRKWLESFNDKTLALETEGEGLSEVLEQDQLSSERGHLRGVLVVRGISDHADEEKADNPQPTAAGNAFEAVLALFSGAGSLCNNVKAGEPRLFELDTEEPPRGAE